MVKYRIQGLVALAGFLMVVGSAYAEDYRIGYVNTARILDESQAAKDVKTMLEKKYAPREASLKKLQQRLQALQGKLDKDGATMAQKARQDTEREMSDLSRDFQRQQREFREDLINDRNEALKKLQDRANTAINKIAEGQKYDLIVQEPVVYASKKIDITDQVIKTLDATK